MLERDERNIVICFFYLAHDYAGPVPGIVICSLVRDYAIGDILLCGDANAHHVIWGSSDINVRGELLYDYVLSNNIYVCKKGNNSTFIIKNWSEVLHITLASSTLIEQLSSWRMLDEHSFSVHRYIEINIMDKCTSAKRIVNVRKNNFEYNKNGLAHSPLSTRERS